MTFETFYIFLAFIYLLFSFYFVFEHWTYLRSSIWVIKALITFKIFHIFLAFFFLILMTFLNLFLP
jgi:hypothetical protein